MGLYISHLFADSQIVLTPNWLDKLVPIQAPDYKFLSLFRPSSVDLILTKMMRNDKEDIEDIRFIMSHDRIDAAKLDAAFAGANRTQVAEMQGTFVKMQPMVRKLSLELGQTWDAERQSARDRPPLEQDWRKKLTDQPPIERAKEEDRELEP